MNNGYLSEVYERPVPRYTSYPTAMEFHSSIGAPDTAQALSAVTPGTPVSLYVHIPYCREICWYCGCNTGALGNGRRLDSYIEALEAEIATVAPLMRGQVVSIHFGGGSPNALAAPALAGLIDRLRTSFDAVARPEIAVELDPRLASADYAQVMAKAGVTRASLGVQCFAPHVQARINRVQPAEMVEQAVNDLREAGILAVNFDLLHGLPLQTSQDVADTIERTLTMRPDRIALFAYAHNPRLLPRQRMIDAATLPQGPERFVQAQLAHDLLVAAGYEAIGFDHFALPTDPLALAARQGRLRRNFQGFTDEPGESVIGLGASSISQFSGLLAQNEKHVGRYRQFALAGMLPTVRGAARSAEDRIRGEAIERLLCDGELDLDRFAARHGASTDAFASARTKLQGFADRNVVTLEGGRLSVPIKSRQYLRAVASAFDQYR
ncbi:oxygen-independent coproporphyrinogen III oxidase [Novosphingobium sp. Rr 2-17]|uniref:oxygen-independent coproporphyrinogen III oxidase n=1 Tax=Novosphingobium sp. Rr 2-17 TaxID=555793 RepID=UPI0002697E4C|nr:oxygen-independent coproporphyrinogen III oxidase [Novosphingobium sp. Rr 2-17]EIZ80743.1 oxygen-independent coproporphyrinogen III oxidase [Novosphingobium sp. Rr 2-17]